MLLQQLHAQLYRQISSISHQRWLAILLIFLFAVILSPVAAQSPPGPQPGADPRATVSAGDNSPTKTQSSNSHAITGSDSVNSTVTTPRPQVITTVNVINGTTTTLVTTITAAQPASQAAPPTSSIPKAPQSVLVVQSTTYGKALPAAGPVDDHIDSNFWDQFVPRPDGARKSTATHGQPTPSLSIHSITCCLLVIFSLANI